ncbi:signal transduction histidine kinase [Pseudomonas citronellolis]|uniref:ATP-binding protein n=1 Tax=Pseudomonas citronellolis TaxID=53408 RepID=UPI0020A12AB7|nr:ATP-binding protein [Pseudomonas citronellolis]MCP1644923.1 signal transduction histidine kinase [Pseudomonas citronellolis]MCP1667868.1 signal transduction histidine kinase [Pseudomonas citronellolis]MCP1699036.1 signal transduction histidine kinase [Pseudomonas citronellolis]MCP1704975.1 signal transduction histidine kinase [Pseudomonas citronellolis]MCP1799599.1 signal transduction histidine kinase [Pseudomonas citronellolis]
MRLWPRTLFGRLVVILVGGMLAGQVLTGSIWYDVRHTQALEIPLRLAAARIADLQRMHQARPQAFAENLRALAKPGFQPSLEDTPTALPASTEGMAERLLRRALAEQGGDPEGLRLLQVELHETAGARHGLGTLFADHDARAELLLELPLGDGRWLRLAMTEGQGWSSQSTLDVALDYLLRLYLLRILVVVLLALLAVRLAIGPLNKLARAAEALGDDIQRPPLAVEGPLEVRRAARAFNAMQQRLIANLGERMRFFAAVSHDLRSPITRLRLRTEMLDDAQARQRMRKDLDDMEGMVTATLDFISGSDLEEPRQNLDVNALLQSLQADLEEQGVRIAVQGRAQQPLPGYPLSLRRALDNLVENALRYAGDAEIRVKDGPHRLSLRVLDRGPGIPPDQLERVSEPFYRVEASRNNATGGYGLGLSIAQTIAAAHHGHLVLRNREGGGLEAELLFERRG